jgi:hypothetical protein
MPFYTKLYALCNVIILLKNITIAFNKFLFVATTLLLLLGIGNSGFVIPQDYEEDGLGNLNECILTSGKLLLDAYFNFKQIEIRVKDLAQIQIYFEVAHFKLQHLFCYRQRIFNSDKTNTDAMKPHASCHIMTDVPEYGSPSNWDTPLYENMHIKYAKKAFRSSSRRECNSSLLPEMIKKIQFSRLIRSFHDVRYMKEDEDGKRGTPPLKEKGISYLTDNNVTYKCSSSSNCRERMMWKSDRLTCSSRHNRFQNPNISLRDVMKAMDACAEDDTGVRRFLEIFKSGSTGDIYI